jgi:predicted secreted protein
MTNIKIDYLNLGGIGFTADSSVLKKEKIYNLKLLNENGADIIKIMIIGIGKDGTNYVYRAVFRNLGDAQINVLKELAKDFKSWKMFLMNNKVSITCSELEEVAEPCPSCGGKIKVEAPDGDGLCVKRICAECDSCGLNFSFFDDYDETPYIVGCKHDFAGKEKTDE